MPRRPYENALEFIELAVLRLLSDGEGKVSQNDILNRLFDEFIIKHAVPPGIAATLESSARIAQAVHRLRLVGTMTPEGKYDITEKGKQFITKLGDNPSDWPAYVPIKNGKLMLQQSTSFKDVRGRRELDN
jgi:hypothetical protein